MPSGDPARPARRLGLGRGRRWSPALPPAATSSLQGWVWPAQGLSGQSPEAWKAPLKVVFELRLEGPMGICWTDKWGAVWAEEGQGSGSGAGDGGTCQGHCREPHASLGCVAALWAVGSNHAPSCVHEGQPGPPSDGLLSLLMPSVPGRRPAGGRVVQFREGDAAWPTGSVGGPAPAPSHPRTWI